MLGWARLRPLRQRIGFGLVCDWATNRPRSRWILWPVLYDTVLLKGWKKLTQKHIDRKSYFNSYHLPQSLGRYPTPTAPCCCCRYSKFQPVRSMLPTWESPEHHLMFKKKKNCWLGDNVHLKRRGKETLTFVGQVGQDDEYRTQYLWGLVGLQ